MKNALIINTHHPYPFSEGKLNAELVRRIDRNLKEKGFETEHTATSEGWDDEHELQLHEWADVIIVQAPVNWMSVPWPMKKYMDDVYSAGLGGRLCNTDGRTEEAPKDNYGTGGVLHGKKYMLSLTFNAPKEAFDDPSQYLFQGKSVDDLLFPVHTNFRFFAMEALPTFSCFDVMKNPTIEDDFLRLEAHLDQHFKRV